MTNIIPSELPGPSMPQCSLLQMPDITGLPSSRLRHASIMHSRCPACIPTTAPSHTAVRGPTSNFMTCPPPQLMQNSSTGSLEYFNQLQQVLLDNSRMEEEVRRHRYEYLRSYLENARVLQEPHPAMFARHVPPSFAHVGQVSCIIVS